MMRRRQFLASGFLSIATQSAAWAVQGAAVHRLAIVHPSEPPQALTSSNDNLVGNALRRLEKLGFAEGKSLEVFRFCALGSTSKLRELVSNAVATKPDVILAISGKTVTLLKEMTGTIAIVGAMSDPIAYGLVTSLSHPGGNITGASVDPGIQIWVKRMTILKEAVPRMTRVFYVAPDTTWTTAVGVGVKAAGEKTGVTLVGPPVDSPHGEAEYKKAFAEASAEIDAVIVSSAPENFTVRKLIVGLTQERRLPALYPYRNYVTEGGLMSHDIDLTDVWLKIAEQIAAIFRGEKPGNIPIYQPRQFRFIINMAAAKAIGFQFNQNLIAMADEIVD
jgi:putative tryptophan/tyrosine transport system substrate-binding protein